MVLSEIMTILFHPNIRYLMIGKGNKHLKDWSECSLSLLDKIQIFNTFSISQYLHALMAIDISPDQ